MKMNKEVIEQWVDALQNGEYVQTQKVLREVDVRNSESFCCLGVLCDLYAKSHKGANWSDDFDGGLFAIGDEEKEGERHRQLQSGQDLIIHNLKSAFV